MKASVDMGASATRLHFGAFVLDLRRAELALAGKPVALRPKALALLSLLAGQAGRAVSKEELLAALWPGVVVTDDSLTQCVAELRVALGDRGGQTFVRTLPRLGYRFEMPVQVLQDETAIGAGHGQPEPAVTPEPPQASDEDRIGAARAAAVNVASWWRKPLAAAGIGLVALAAAAALVPAWRSSPPPPQQQHIDAELVTRRSMAVMPFADRSATPAPHFAEAVVEEILTDVARMRDTLVIASGTTRALAARGQTDPEQVGRELGVQFVLSGSLLREGERLQVHVQLSRAAGGALVWSERFDYVDAAAWNWRRDVSERVAGSIDVKMHQSALDHARHAGRSSEAMEQWMHGEYLLRRYSAREVVLRARQHFEAALAAEPRSVNALIGLARTHLAEVLERWRVGHEKAESLGQAKQHLLAALAIDPNHSVAMGALGNALLDANDFEEAEQVLIKALTLNPNDAVAHRTLGVLKFFMARFDEVQPHIRVALRLNPLEPFHVHLCHMVLGDSLMHLGLDAAAREHHLLAVLAEPTRPNPYFSMASHAALRGRIDEARMHLAQALQMRPGATIARSAAGDRSNHPMYLAARNRYRDGLRLAGLPEDQPVGSRD